MHELIWNIFRCFLEKYNNKSPSALDEQEIKAARIFGLLPISTINRSKAKSQPSPRPISSSSYTENDVASAASSFQKTSIKINIDECSSTVHVSDNVKLYHSSVLINSSTNHIDNKKDRKTVEHLTSDRKLLDHDIKSTPSGIASKNESTAIAIQYTNTNQLVSERNPLKQFLAINEDDMKTLISLRNFNSEYLFVNAGESATTNHGAQHRSSSNADDLSVDNSSDDSLNQRLFLDSFILKLLSDPYLSHLLHGLEVKSIANIIKKSLARIPIKKMDFDAKNDEIDDLLLKELHELIKEERNRIENSVSEQNVIANVCPGKSSDTNRPNVLNSETIPIRKICEMLTECSFSKKGESSIGNQGDHQYESICLNSDPIYEEINDEPPPLPTNPPPGLQAVKHESLDKHHRSMFLGATKYDILSYLVDAKDRIAPEDQILSYTYKFLQRSIDDSAIESSRGKSGKIVNCEPEISCNTKLHKTQADKNTASIERNDSGVGSETSNKSRTKYRPGTNVNVISPIHLCEDCGNFTFSLSEITCITANCVLGDFCLD